MGKTETAIGLGLLTATSLLASAAFSPESRKKILQRDNFQSQVSGQRGRLEAAHYDHSRANPNYDDPNNGRSLTPREHYLDHFYRHGKRELGLNDEGNIWALERIWERLSPQERNGLPNPRSVRRR